jgi:Tol biopolymer transport system component
VLHGIYVMNADGSDLRRLTGVDADLPRWSPGGGKLAYVANLWQVGGEADAPEAVSSNRAVIAVMNADGTGKRRLARSGYTSDLAWSPNGHWIAFLGGACCAGGSLNTVRATGGDLHALSRHAYVGAFAWSPDGTRLAFASSEVIAGSRSIYVVRLATGRKTRLTAISESEVPSISWSPDGAWIAFVGAGISTSGDSLQGARAFVVRSRGGTPRFVSSPGAFPRYNNFTTGVAWLPGTKHLILYNTDNGVYLTSPRRQHMRRINHFDGSPAVPSPDGTKFVVEQYSSEAKNALYLEKFDGAAHQLTQAGKR